MNNVLIRIHRAIIKRIYAYQRGIPVVVALAAMIGATLFTQTASAHLRRGHPLVIGGEAAEPGMFRSLAFVADLREGGEAGVCSGTVVAPRLVLTAAHCAEDLETGEPNDPAGYRVVTGNVDWTDSEREVLHVSQVAIYPRFNPDVANDDAALLVLSEPTSAPTATLARRPADASWLRSGTGALLVGWGMTEYEQEEPTTVLQYGETVVQRPRWCARHARPFYPREELCVIAPEETTGVCHGDSGGPLIVNVEGEEIDVGITSHGYGRCDTDRPSVYTRVDAVYPWIQQWIGALG